MIDFLQKHRSCYDKLNKRKVLIFLLLITIIGFLLRLYHLSNPSLWYDEMATAYRIDHSLIQTIKRLSVSPFPPLYYIIMNLWVKFFGNSEFSLRFPSLISSTLSIIFIFKLSKVLFGEKVGLIAALLLSVSPYSINYAQEAKMYAMLWLLGILSFYFFYRFSKDNKFRSLLLYVIFTTMCIYTLYVGFIFMIIQNILFFTFLNREQYKKWLLGQLIIILLYLPWINIFLYTTIHKVGIGWITKITNPLKILPRIFRDVIGISIGNKNLISSYLYYLYSFLAISAVVTFKNIKYKRQLLNFKRNDYLIIAWITLPIIIYFLIDIFYFPIFGVTRYMGFIHIPLIILFSKGLNKYNLKVKSIILFFILLIIFSNHLHSYYKYNLKLNREDWRGLINQLHEKASAEDLIVSDRLIRRTLNYYNKNKFGMKSIRYISEEKDFVKKYGSIFVVYCRPKHKIQAPEGYRLKEDHAVNSFRNTGFLWFTKLP